MSGMCLTRSLLQIGRQKIPILGCTRRATFKRRYSFVIEITFRYHLSESCEQYTMRILCEASEKKCHNIFRHINQNYLTGQLSALI